MDHDEFVWRLYESEREFIKHHENQRTNASSILAVIYAALLVALTSDLVDGTRISLLLPLWRLWEGLGPFSVANYTN